jgi:prepilin peptidase CpaA
MHLIPLGICLSIAAISDLWKRKIPNSVSAATAVAGLGAQLWDRGGAAALSGLAAAVVTIALLYRPWTLGMMGGGDVKLAGGVAVWVGLGGLIVYMLAGAVAGGVIALVGYVASRKSIRKEIRQNLVTAVVQQRMPEPAPETRGRVSLPYGIAVAVGGLVALWR